MAKIIGDIVGVPNPQSDCLQTDPTKADFVKNKHIFANAIRGTVSGEDAVSVDDVSPVQHVLDVTVASKNLLDISSIIGKTVSNNGGTLTVGADGGVTGSGTPTGSVYTNSVRVYLPKTKVTISASGTFAGMAIEAQVKNQNNSIIKSHSVYTSSTIDLSTYPDYAFITVAVKRATNNVEMSGTMYMQVELGETATTYTPYVAVEGVTVTRTGKNHLRYPYYNTPTTGNVYHDNGIDFTDNGDGTITANGTATKRANFYCRHTNSLVLKAGHTYALSGCAAGGSNATYRITLQNNDGTFAMVDAGKSYIATPTTEQKCFVAIRIEAGTTLNNLVFKPMLEIGETATEYEAYKEPQTATANADGTVAGLTSISPNMVIQSEQGVVINAEYTVDTKTAIEKMIVEAVKKYTGVG